jgi:hypothetical protein
LKLLTKQCRFSPRTSSGGNNKERLAHAAASKAGGADGRSGEGMREGKEFVGGRLRSRGSKSPLQRRFTDPVRCE